MLRTVIPRNIRPAEAPSYGKPILNTTSAQGAEVISVGRRFWPMNKPPKAPRGALGKDFALLPNREAMPATAPLSSPLIASESTTLTRIGSTTPSV